jgi:hypothetical protein
MNTVSPLARRNDRPIDDIGLDSPKTSDPPRPPRSEVEERKAATARHDAACADLDDSRNHDFDACRLDRVDRPVLYAPQAGDEADVDANDVRQGRIGDCFLLVTMAALASTAEGRALIKKAIVENKDETGQVTSYTVTLHKPESRWGGLRTPTFSDVRVTVDAVFAVGHAETRNDGANREIWSAVLERAVADYLGGYNELRRGGSATVAMRLLTGKPVDAIELDWLHGYGADRLTRDLSAGKIVVFGTKDDFGSSGREDLVQNHSYHASGMQVVDGRLCVTLHNPWNRGDPKPVPIDGLKKWFQSVDVGSVK